MASKSILRFRELCYVEPVSSRSVKFQSFQTPEVEKTDESSVEKKQWKRKKQQSGCRCIDSCCWVVGYICTAWWVLLLLYHSLPVTLTGFQVPESPGTRLKGEGLTALHPVVLVPGIVTCDQTNISTSC